MGVDNVFARFKLTSAVLNRIRAESGDVLVLEDANPGSPNRTSIYVSDLIDAIEQEARNPEGAK